MAEAPHFFLLDYACMLPPPPYKGTTTGCLSPNLWVNQLDTAEIKCSFWGQSNFQNVKPGHKRDSFYFIDSRIISF